MKKIITLFLIIFLSTVITACKPDYFLIITADDLVIELTVGEEYTISPSTTEGVELVWESDDTDIVMVDDGTIVAILPGQTTVTVSISGTNLSETIDVSVAYAAPLSIAISGEPEIIVGNTSQLSAAVSPVGANQSVTWSSSDETVAQISSSGLVTALKAGSATIYATSTLPTIQGSLAIEVVLPDPTSITVSGPNEIFVGEASSLYTAIVSPDLASSLVVWSTSNSEVATVNQSGEVSGIASGVVEIIATSSVLNTVVGRKEITISMPPLTSLSIGGRNLLVVGEEETYSVTATPNTASNAVNWSVNSTTIATISENGLLTALTPGTVTITATSIVNTNIFVELEVVIETNEFILIDASLAETPDGTPIIVGTTTYKKGVNAFADFDGTVGKIFDGTTITVRAGLYQSELIIDKNNVSIIGPNKDVDPNTRQRIPEAIFTKDISIASGVNNLSINGIKLTQTAKIKGNVAANIDGVRISYLLADEISVDSSMGVIYFTSEADTALNKNIVIEYSRFGQTTTDTRIIRGSNIENLTVQYTHFYSGFDIIRLMGTMEASTAGIGIGGQLIIDNCYFTGAKQYNIYATRYDFSLFQLTNSVFEDMADPAYAGIFRGLNFNDSVASVQVEIKYNVFDNVFDWHLFRFTTNSRTIDTWKANINYNAFLSTPNNAAKDYDYVAITSNLTGTAAQLADVTKNYFTGTDGEAFVPTDANFINVLSYGQSFATREALNQEMVYAQLDQTADDILVVGTSSFPFTKPLYANLADALAAATENDTIVLLPGIHAGNVTIQTNHLVITSLNGGKNPNDNQIVRLAEAEITGSITLAKKLQNITIDGLLFTGNAQIKNTIGDAGIATATTKNIEGFQFTNNQVHTALASGNGFIYFVEAASSYSYDLTFENNYFTTTSAGNQLLSVVYLDNLASLRLVDNVFDQIENDAFYVFDTTKGFSGVFSYIAGNQFSTIQGNAFWANWMSPFMGTVGKVQVLNNNFENIGGQAIHFGNMNNTDMYSEISIQYNTFTNFAEGIYFNRVHANANIQISYNKFYSVATTYYVKDGKDASTSSPSTLDATNNFYMEAGVVVTPNADKFVGSPNYTTAYTAEEQVPIYAGEGEVGLVSIVISPLAEDLFLGKSSVLELGFQPENATTVGVNWTSSNPSIVSVDSKGKITGLALGTATITATSTYNDAIYATILIEVVNYENLEVRFEGNGLIEVGKDLQLTTTILPSSITGTISYNSKNPTIASVSASGLVSGLVEGMVTIEVSLGDMMSTITLQVKNRSQQEVDPVQFIIDANIGNILARNITTFGSTTKVEQTYGAVSFIKFGDLNVIERISPKNNSREGFKLISVEFIVVHDTGNNNAGANGVMHTNYLINNDPGVSWHYVVDQNAAYHNVPNDEIAYHAGDGLRPYTMLDTGVIATTPIPVITISTDGFYVLNGVKTTISAPLIDGNIPTTNKITPAGIYTYINDNNTYMMNQTYYNTTYKLIANQGGGSNGIGIESCVDQGSNLYATWQNLAQLVSELLVEFDLGLDRVLQHNHFSGKPCPQTLRTANLIDYFLTMVQFEYDLRTTYKDYTFNFTSNNPNIVDNSGIIIHRPNRTTQISYTVDITGPNSYSQSVTLYSVIPGVLSIG